MRLYFCPFYLYIFDPSFLRNYETYCTFLLIPSQPGAAPTWPRFQSFSTSIGLYQLSCCSIWAKQDEKVLPEFRVLVGGWSHWIVNMTDSFDNNRTPIFKIDSSDWMCEVYLNNENPKICAVVQCGGEVFLSLLVEAILPVLWNVKHGMASYH